MKQKEVPLTISLLCKLIIITTNSKDSLHCVMTAGEQSASS